MKVSQKGTDFFIQFEMTSHHRRRQRV